MKFHHQTTFGMPNGNCFATCMACILDLDVDQVPNFMHEGDEWFAAAQSWLSRRYSLRLLTLKWDARENAAWGLGKTLCIASGPASRGFMHSVVWQAGKMIHDPHPDGTGLIGDPEDYVVFLATDPSLGIGAAG